MDAETDEETNEVPGKSKWIVRTILIALVMFLMNPEAKEHSKEARHYVDAFTSATLKLQLALAQLEGVSTREQQANALYGPVKFKDYHLFSKAEYIWGESYGVLGMVFFKFNSISGIGAFRKLFFSDAGTCIDVKEISDASWSF